jgi:hypothetical protein
MSSDKPRCLHCDNWGCSRCTPRGGEQSPTVDEYREARLRDRVAELERECTRRAMSEAELRALVEPSGEAIERAAVATQLTKKTIREVVTALRAVPQ